MDLDSFGKKYGAEEIEATFTTYGGYFFNSGQFEMIQSEMKKEIEEKKRMIEVEIETDLDDLIKAIITSNNEPTPYDILDALDREYCQDLGQHVYDWMEDQDLLKEEQTGL